MSGGMVRALTWLVALAMIAGAVLPPASRLECRCGAIGGGAAVSLVAVAEPDAVGSQELGCCDRHRGVGHTPEPEGTPAPDEQDRDEGCCDCPGVCCVVVRPVLVDRVAATEVERAEPGHVESLTGSQTSAASAHAGRLLRPPRA